jgi:hypothetical protein
MPKFPNAIGGSYVSESPIADCERTVNWYIEKMEVPGAQQKAKAVLYPAPGVRRYASTTALNGRGLFAQNNYVLAGIGDKLFRVTNLATTIDVGTIKTDNNPVTMCTNGEGGGQAFVTSGTNGYIVDVKTDAMTLVRTGATSMGAMLDTYFLALDAATSTLFLSDLNDGTVWDPTQFAQRTIAPDPWISFAVNYREIWLFGTESSEVWVNVGSFPFPFAPHPSGLIPYGIAAPFSVKNVAGTLIWLARTPNGTGQVVAAQGFSPAPISTHALQVAINSYDRIDDAIGDTFQMLGHSFYVLTFPSAQATWVYDASTQVWVEWLTWVPDLNEYIAWRPLFHAHAFDKHLVLDRAAGNIYETSHEFTTDVDDRFIRRLRRFPGMVNEMDRVFYDELVLYLETGLGLPVGQGSNPQLMMRHSDDGGKVFGNERWTSAGREGQYKRLAQWNRLGSGRDRVFEFTVSDPIPWRIIDAFVTIRKGSH